MERLEDWSAFVNDAESSQGEDRESLRRLFYALCNATNGGRLHDREPGEGSSL